VCPFHPAHKNHDKTRGRLSKRFLGVKIQWLTFQKTLCGANYSHHSQWA
jgi:hypothetical protein